ncbi:MAG: hypothetical protein ACKVP4_04110 [Hyphomicrobium sp.]
MSGFANDNARKRTDSKLGVVRPQATRQQFSQNFGSAACINAAPTPIMSQFNSGVSPLSDEEVRLLPIAHQYSS